LHQLFAGRGELPVLPPSIAVDGRPRDKLQSPQPFDHAAYLSRRDGEPVGQLRLIEGRCDCGEMRRVKLPQQAKLGLGYRKAVDPPRKLSRS
jgi:hypothetical protein